MTDETVNHPEHYGGDTVYEAIKVIEAWRLGFHLGNAVKYISRAGKKSPATEVRQRTLEDLKKARWYLDREIARLELGVEVVPSVGRVVFHSQPFPHR
jgi:hypothetical protein